MPETSHPSEAERFQELVRKTLNALEGAERFAPVGTSDRPHLGFDLHWPEGRAAVSCHFIDEGSPSAFADLMKAIRRDHAAALACGLELHRLTFVFNLPEDELLDDYLRSLENGKPEGPDLAYWGRETLYQHGRELVPGPEATALEPQAPAEEHVVPRLLTPLPKLGGEALLLPEDLLRELHAELLALSPAEHPGRNARPKGLLAARSPHLAVSSPTPGAGCTSLAKAYVHSPECAERFGHLAWVWAEHVLEHALLELLPAFGPGREGPVESIDQALAGLAADMARLPRPGLLVVDGLSDPKAWERLREWASGTGWQILLTAQRPLPGAKTFAMPPLPEVRANQIVRANYPKTREGRPLAALVKALDANPLLLRLAARVAKNTPGQGLAELAKAVREKDQLQLRLKEHLPEWLDAKGQEPWRKTLKKAIALVELASTRTKPELRLWLTWLSVIPKVPYTLGQLEEFFGIEKARSRDFAESLMEAVDMGLLLAREDQLAMPGLVATAWRKAHRPDMKACRPLVARVAERLLLESDAGPALRRAYLSLALALLRQLDEPDAELAAIANNATNPLDDLGDPHRSLELMKRTMEIEEQILEPNDPSLSDTYRNVSICHGRLGHRRDELEFALRSLEILERQREPDPILLADRRTELAEIYMEQDELDHALENSDWAIDLFRQHVPEGSELLRRAKRVRESINLKIKEKERDNWFRRWFGGLGG